MRYDLHSLKTTACWFSLTLIAYAGAWHLAPSLYQVAETLLVLLFLLCCCHQSNAPLRQDTGVQVAFLLLAYILLSHLYRSLSLPDDLAQKVRFSRYYAKPMLVVMVGYGLARSKWLSPWTFLAIIWIGLLTAIIAYNHDAIRELISAHRASLGFLNAQHTGAVFGTALIALVLSLPRCLHRPHKAVRHYLWLVFHALSIAVAVAIVALTQVRAVWLGLAVCLPVGTIAHLWTSRMSAPGRGIERKAAIMAVTLVFGVLGSLAAVVDSTSLENRVVDRLEINKQAITNLEHAINLEPFKESSSAVRVASWAASWEWFSERPLLGWGPGVTDDLIDQSDFFSPRFKKRFGHLHNTYLETLVATGVLGFSLIAALVFVVGWRAVQAFRSGAMPADALTFAATFTAFWLTVNVFESYIMFNSGHFIHACIGGFIYHFHLRQQIERPTP
ncbi:O-antigen ligase family protein [Halomonadaceae bacterium KBTZ08]